MEYYNNILCISGTELIQSDGNPKGLVSRPHYDKLCRANRLNVLRRGCYGNPALIEFDSLPIKYRHLAEQIYGDPAAYASKQSFVGRIVIDSKAVEFYSSYTLMSGEYLPEKNQTQYSNEASILNTVRDIINASSTARKKFGKRTSINWDTVTQTVHDQAVKALYPHSLPSNPQTLRRKYKKYIDEGYEGLIHSGFCNDNKRKVSVHVERLLMSLYTMPNKPFAATVYEMYGLFIKGHIQVFDKKTGELFDPAMFQKNGQPIELSESTVWNYLNNPLNRIIVDESRNDASYNSRVNRPFHRRKSPNYSFSKISLDDRDLTRKLHNGSTVKAYYAYDVASGCVIGAAYSLSKDETLFLDCLRDTFRTIERNNWGIPMEVEVEHHLVNKFFDDLAMMFPYMRICNAGNSKEKRAEHSNRAKKYGAEKRLGIPVGRWWARSEAYYQPQNKINDQYVMHTGDYDQIVADDMAAIKLYNNELHPRQKKYTGMTRWEVLCDKINPDLPKLNKAMLYRYIGYSTQTSIRNNKELTVQYAQYQLPSVDVVAKLQPNNYSVTAYYMIDDDRNISEIYLYQGDKYICTCQKLNPYNEARAEWTAEDEISYKLQSGYDAHYRKVVKDGKQELSKIAMIESEQLERINSAEAIVPELMPYDDNIDIEELLNNFDPNEVKLNAFNNL